MPAQVSVFFPPPPCVCVFYKDHSTIGPSLYTFIHCDVRIYAQFVLISPSVSVWHRRALSRRHLASVGFLFLRSLHAWKKKKTSRDPDNKFVFCSLDGEKGWKADQLCSFCLVRRKSGNESKSSSNWQAITTGGVRNKNKTKNTGKYVASKQRRDLSMITFSLLPYHTLSLSLFARSFPVYVFCLLDYPRGVWEAVTSESWGEWGKKKKRKPPPYRKDMSYRGSPPRGIAIPVPRGKWIPTTPLSYSKGQIDKDSISR